MHIPNTTKDILSEEGIIILVGTIKSERTKNIEMPDSKGPVKSSRFAIENSAFEKDKQTLIENYYLFLKITSYKLVM
jgi:hypothetical protein